MPTQRLHRGVDVRDVAEAHRLALEPPASGYDVFNISARSPFSPEHCVDLYRDAPATLMNRFPDIYNVFMIKGWPVPTRIDRVMP